MIDSHCHLDFEVFDNDLAEVIKSSGVSSFINPSVAVSNFEKVKNISTKYPNIYGAYGLHPWMIDEHQEKDIEKLDDFLSQNDAVAVGEIGIDLWDKFKKSQEKQQWFFIEQLKLADKYNLPIIVHSRKSVEVIIEILKKMPKITGVFHGFAGSLQQAEILINRGFYLGVGSIITYPNTKIRQVIKQIPLEKLVLETDAPPHRANGVQTQRNEPKYLIKIAEVIATLKNKSLLEVEKICDRNSQKIFKL